MKPEKNGSAIKDIYQERPKPYDKASSKQSAKPASRKNSAKKDFLQTQTSNLPNQRPSTQHEVMLTNLHKSVVSSAPSSPTEKQTRLVRGEFLKPIEEIFLPHNFKENAVTCFAAGFPFFFAYTREQNGNLIISDAHESLYNILDTKPGQFASKERVEDWKKLASKTSFAMTQKEGASIKSIGTINDLDRCGIDPSAMIFLLDLTHMTGDLPYGREDTYLIESALFYAVLSKAGIDIIDHGKITEMLQAVPRKHVDAVKAELLRSVAAWKNPNILHEMLRQGYNPNTLSPLSLTNPIYMAMLHRREENRKLLLQYGAKDEPLRPEEPLEENFSLSVI